MSRSPRAAATRWVAVAPDCGTRGHGSLGATAVGRIGWDLEFERANTVWVAENPSQGKLGCFQESGKVRQGVAAAPSGVRQVAPIAGPRLERQVAGTRKWRHHDRCG